MVLLENRDIPDNDPENDILSHLSKLYYATALLLYTNIWIHKCVHAHAQTLTLTDLISTWKQILQYPPVWCAKLSWWLHLVYISLELDHNLQQGFCLSLICSLAYLLLIRKSFQNNASNCAHKESCKYAHKQPLEWTTVSTSLFNKTRWKGDNWFRVCSVSHKFILMLKLINRIFF